MKQCIICETSFSPTNNSQKTCGRNCYNERKKQTNQIRHKMNYVKKTFEERNCTVCEQSYIPRQPNQKRCGKECNQKFLKENYPMFAEKKETGNKVKENKISKAEMLQQSWKFHFNAFLKAKNTEDELYLSDHCNTINEANDLGNIHIDWNKYR